MEARIASTTRMVGGMSERGLRKRELSKSTKPQCLNAWCPRCCTAVRCGV